MYELKFAIYYKQQVSPHRLPMQYWLLAFFETLSAHQQYF